MLYFVFLFAWSKLVSFSILSLIQKLFILYTQELPPNRDRGPSFSAERYCQSQNARKILIVYISRRRRWGSIFMAALLL
jgi:hypothetical protein